MNRRHTFTALLAVLAAPILARSGRATSLPKMAVYRSPGCGCCEGWTQHAKAAGFDVSVEDGRNPLFRAHRKN